MKFNYDFFEILGREDETKSLYVTVSVPDGKRVVIRIKTCQWAFEDVGGAQEARPLTGTGAEPIELDVAGAMALKKILEQIEDGLIMEDSK